MNVFIIRVFVLLNVFYQFIDETTVLEKATPDFTTFREHLSVAMTFTVFPEANVVHVCLFIREGLDRPTESMQLVVSKLTFINLTALLR